MRIHITQIPYDVPTFHVKLQNYLLARVAHRLTEGVPAPFPENEIFRVMAERIEAGEAIEVYDDRPPDPVTQTLPELITQDQINTEIQKRSLWERIVDVFAP